ncbi:hypothetical protein P3S68_032946 [Capsicum galapagoense]
MTSFLTLGSLILKLFATNLKLQQIRVLLQRVLVVELFVMVAAILIPSHPYSGPSHPSSLSCSHCKYKVCKDREDKLLEKLEAIAKAIEEFKFRRGVIPSNEVREPCTPTVAVRKKKKKFRQILSVLKIGKTATPSAPRVVEVQGPLKKMDIFMVLGKEKKKKLQEIMNGRTKVQKEYTTHSFAAKDLTNMTNMRL